LIFLFNFLRIPEKTVAQCALAALDTEVVSLMADTEWNNSVIYRWLGEGFEALVSINRFKGE
jgi:hypothetical protein